MGWIFSSLLENQRFEINKIYFTNRILNPKQLIFSTAIGASHGTVDNPRRASAIVCPGQVLTSPIPYPCLLTSSHVSPPLLTSPCLFSPHLSSPLLAVQCHCIAWRFAAARGPPAMGARRPSGTSGTCYFNIQQHTWVAVVLYHSSFIIHHSSFIRAWSA